MRHVRDALDQLFVERCFVLWVCSCATTQHPRIMLEVRRACGAICSSHLALLHMTHLMRCDPCAVMVAIVFMWWQLSSACVLTSNIPRVSAGAVEYGCSNLSSSGTRHLIVSRLFQGGGRAFRSMQQCWAHVFSAVGAARSLGA
jgi:hypothetical protein